MTSQNNAAAPVFLQEAEYHITPPPSVEPQVRVGVVLTEDQITSETITFPLDGEILGSDGGLYPVNAGTEILIEALNTGLVISSAGNQIAQSEDKVILRTHQPIVYAPKCGFLVSRIVAGRIFHWRKEIAQYFTGKLEIRNVGGVLQVVNELPFEEYLSGVATAEMSSECPMDTLKAQVLAARSYSLAYMHGKHPGEPFSVCNDDDCQRYQGSTHVYPHIHQAIQETKGEVILFNGNVVRAHYSKCCGGFMASAQDTWEISVPGLAEAVFDGKDSPIEQMDLSDEQQYRKYLDLPQSAFRNVYCSAGNLPPGDLKKYLGSVDEQAEYMRWTYEISAEKLADNLRERFKVEDIAQLLKIEAAPSRKSGKLRTRSGHLVAIDVSYIDTSGQLKVFHIPREYNIRRALHDSFLFSAAFIYENVCDQGRLIKVRFRGSGWGHAAGYCQIGGLGMGLKGIKYKEIVRHYFPNCRIDRAY